MKSNDISEQKRGYLKGDFAFFHLKDMKDIRFEYHYHDFNKIIIFISGDVTYQIEGKAYRLKPWDILFVSNNELHKPIIDSSFPYERVVIWVNPSFIERHSCDSDLFTCFKLTSKRKNNLLRLEGALIKDIRRLVLMLEDGFNSSGFGSVLLRNSIFVQLLIVLTRALLGINPVNIANDVTADENIQKLLNYINSNLNENLSIEALASKFYLSKYHLMRKFKKHTGYSVHSYIMHKRLLKADALVRSGLSATQACEQSGFGDYSSFLRAFKKMFGMTPKERAADEKIRELD